MKNIVFSDNKENEIYIDQVSGSCLLYTKTGGELDGFVHLCEKGYSLRIDIKRGSCGFFCSKKELMKEVKSISPHRKFYVLVGKIEKEVILEKEQTKGEINFDDVDQNGPIFAKRNGNLLGMMVHENEGWILKVGGRCGSHGHCVDLKENLLEGAQLFDYEFYVEG